MKTYGVGHTYKINDIFYSLQGEGTNAGMPMVFVRFCGCNLKCPFCDTPHEKVEHIVGSQDLLLLAQATMPDVNQRVPVCFTGGEPTLQLDWDLMGCFIQAKFSLHLETNGTKVPIEPNFFDTITISPKTLPTYVMIESFLKHVDEQDLGIDLKIVYDMQNPEMTKKLIISWGQFPFRNKFIQPCDSPSQPDNIPMTVDYVKNNPSWRLSYQIHKRINIK